MSLGSSINTSVEKGLWLCDKMGSCCCDVAERSTSYHGNLFISRMFTVSDTLAEEKKILSIFIREHGATRIRKERRFTQRNSGTPFTIHMNDIACHNEQKIINQLAYANIPLLPHPSCSPDLNPCDLWLFSF
jgi:hypothetical protein